MLEESSKEQSEGILQANILKNQPDGLAEGNVDNVKSVALLPSDHVDHYYRGTLAPNRFSDIMGYPGPCAGWLRA